jgi:4,5-DOPA dioxygenase extradiol
MADLANMNKDNYGYDWAIEVRENVNSLLLDGNYTPLIQFEKQSKAFQLAIPTPDHYIPLLYILGLQQKNEQLLLFNDKLVAGSLSMTSVKIG